MNASVLYKSVVLLLLIIIITLIVFPRPLQQPGSESALFHDALTIIHRRKSVRAYLNKPVTKAQLEILMKAGMAAPTAGDRRPWSFVAINDQQQLTALSSALPYAKMLNKAGAAIVVCGIPEKSYPGIAQEFWVQDCSAATENILLAVEAIDLGAVWIGVYPDPERVAAVQRILGIPDNVIPLNVISIGYPEGTEKPKDKFNPQNIHWEKW